MSKARAGDQYTVVKDDWLSTIAGEAYGDINKWPLIAKANPQINGRGVAVDGSSLIFPDDVLWIPEDDSGEDDSPLTFAEQQKKSFSLTVNGELVPVITGSLVITMDTGSDEVEATVDMDKLSDSLRKALLPFKYPKCQVRINGELMLTGAIYKKSPAATKSKRIVKLTGYSNTADLIDSVMNPPYEESGVLLLNHAQRLVDDFGMKAVFYQGAQEYFDKITVRDGEKRFAHLLKLAKERGLLISCTPYGNPLFLKANTNKRPVETIEEGTAGALGFSSTYDGRKRFRSYRVVGKSVIGKAVTKTVTDPYVRRARFFSKKENRLDDDAEKAALWERSKAIADALSMSIGYHKWTNKRGELWRDNTYVRVISPSLDLTNGVDLLIRRVKYNFTPAGKTVVLDVVPPEVFTGEEIPDIWS
jgi:prophage tail gpP-like protein